MSEEISGKSVRRYIGRYVRKNIRRYVRENVKRYARKNVRRFVRKNVRHNVRRDVRRLSESMSEHVCIECQNMIECKYIPGGSKCPPIKDT